MNKVELKKKVCEAIDKNGEKIMALGREIFENPELGYKEYKTAALVEKVV